jgi:large subunit ribosomal protein L18
MKTVKEQRERRIRGKIKAVSGKPRLSVYRSNKFIYAQIIDDSKKETLIGVSEAEIKKEGLKKSERAKEVGLAIAKKATAKKISEVVFDRGSYRYHGRVKAVAEGAREGGLKF